MKKDSFILYNSFYEPIKALKNEQLGKLLRAIFNYTINGEITQDEDISIAFMFIKNQLDIDSIKWEQERNKRSEAGRLGGIKRAINQNQALSSKSKHCLSQLSIAKQSQANQADNVNVNVNVNDNVNDNVLLLHTTTLYDFVEENFGRTLNSIEVMAIDEWLSWFEEDIIRHAIKISILNNKKTFNYVKGILKNWKTCGYKTLQEIKDIETRREEKSEEKVELFDYDWLNE